MIHLRRFFLYGGLAVFMSSISAWLASRPDYLIQDYALRGLWLLFLAGVLYAIDYFVYGRRA